MAGNNPRRMVVTGAGGFIGHHLVNYLKSSGHWVRGVDLVDPQYEPTQADEFIKADLREFENCVRAVSDVDDVYNLAADMGGIGYITLYHALLTRNNALINLHMLEAARQEGVGRYLYTSSACVYPSFLQNDTDVTPLHEEQAVPADPEKGYGWEKLFAEQVATYYHEEFGLDVRIVRFHNIYGPLGTYEGGREKAPAAICRKVAEAEDGSSIEVWGDGEQTRSFCHIDDCIEGLVRLMDSGYTLPVNLGTDELVTVNQLVDMVCDASGKNLTKEHDLTKPQGVRGRNSDNSLLREVLGWEPQIILGEGIARTYQWIWSELARQGRANPPNPNINSPVPLGQRLAQINKTIKRYCGQKTKIPMIDHAYERPFDLSLLLGRHVLLSPLWLLVWTLNPIAICLEDSSPVFLDSGRQGKTVGFHNPPSTDHFAERMYLATAT